MEKKYHILYKTTNNLNGMIYVGIHSTDDLNDGYLGSGTLIKKSIEEYGRNNFNREIIGIFNDRDSLMKAEEFLIDINFIQREDTLNLALGGCHRGNQLNLGLSWWHDPDGVDRSMFSQDDVIPCGWIPGYGPHENSNLGKNWYHNTITGEKKLCDKEDIPDGWIAGSGNAPNRGKIFIMNINTREGKFIPKDEDIPDGWIVGGKDTIVKDSHREYMRNLYSGKTYEDIMGTEKAEIRKKNLSDKMSGARNNAYGKWPVVDVESGIGLLMPSEEFIGHLVDGTKVKYYPNFGGCFNKRSINTNRPYQVKVKDDFNESYVYGHIDKTTLIFTKY